MYHSLFYVFQIQFFMNFLNIIDLFGILPFFIAVLLNLLNSQYSFEWMAKAAQIFRILRILRIFKLSRHITGLKTLGLTLRNSHRWGQHLFPSTLVSRPKLVQGAAAAYDDCQHGHAHIRGSGLRAGEGRARHHLLHAAPDTLLGHHHHDQHRCIREYL